MLYLTAFAVEFYYISYLEELIVQKVRFTDIDITGGFWKKKQDIVRNVTASAVYDRFYDTGRIDAFS